MFNEILTGKASLEPKPAAAIPPAALPPVQHDCIDCGRRYEAAAGSASARCGACHVAMVERNTALSAQLMHATGDRMRRDARNRMIVRVVLGLVVSAGIIAFRAGMKHQMRDDAAQAAGYRDYDEYKSERDAVYPTDEFSQRVQSFANDMCRCTDLACARTTLAQYRSFLRSGQPSDDTAQASADRDDQRLRDCEANLER